MKKILVALTAVVAIGCCGARGARRPAGVGPGEREQAHVLRRPVGGDHLRRECTVNKYGVATLNNSGGDPDGEYSGVYLQNSNLEGKAIGTVNQLGFSYMGTATAGSPRISLGIDTNGDGDWDDFAFISAFYCDDGAGTSTSSTTRPARSTAALTSIPTGRQWSQLTPTTGLATSRSSSLMTRARGQCST